MKKIFADSRCQRRMGTTASQHVVHWTWLWLGALRLSGRNFPLIRQFVCISCFFDKFGLEAMSSKFCRLNIKRPHHVMRGLRMPYSIDAVLYIYGRSSAINHHQTSAPGLTSQTVET